MVRELRDSQAAPAPVWTGTSRYEVRKAIGAGGMGVVYEAFDHERGRCVAVKTLRRFSPGALYRFKREFRTLSDVVHANLVHLYELVVTENEDAFFAMELVDGVDFVKHAMGPNAPLASKSNPPTMAVTQPSPPAPGAARARIDSLLRESARPLAMRHSPADFKRLRPALRQLVEGVCALHAAGKLHRDIKPSNVLVTAEGRVVLLDFGVATELSQGLDDAVESEMVGTARYMAPEQATEDAATAASDWYSVGVVLYEALVGRTPFVGSPIDVITLKSVFEPPAPSECVDDIPPDLDALCSALLRRAPETRPTGREILRWLSQESVAPPLASPLPLLSWMTETPLIGRKVQLQELRDAFDTARQGRLVTVHVHGTSGMGKSILAQRFIDDLVERGEASVLRGRAYERESVPYKALDSVVDALSRQLMRLDTPERYSDFTLPPDVGALARLFPVLRRVERIAQAPEPLPSERAPSVRRRAVLALRELLAGLTTEQPLVMCIDDVQWGDLDSAALLVDLARPPFAAPVLLVLTHREEEAESSSFLMETRRRWPTGGDVRDISVGPLASEDARSLALVFLRSGEGAAVEAADAIARESGGNPLLIEELARSFGLPVASESAGARSAKVGAIRLEQIVDERMSLLSPDARRLLEIIAVSARPLPVSIVGDAGGVDVRLDETIALLRARRFVRTGFRDGLDVVEVIHDRIRSTIVGALADDAVRAHHRRLAGVLEALPGADAESLAVHMFGAGDNDRGAKYAERAADQAFTKLAFGQAIRNYRLALENCEVASQDARRVRARLAEVLESVGRGVEAASVCMAGAEYAEGIDRIELEREAAEHLITCGHVDEGDVALNRILSAAGIPRPRTVPRALLLALVYRAVVALMGLRHRDRDPRDVSRLDHVRIEALWAVVVGFSFVNVIYGMSAQARHLYVALRSGDRFQVFRAAMIEAANLAARGGPVGKRERALAAFGNRLRTQHPEPEYRAFGDGVDGMRLFFRGSWKDSFELLDRAHQPLTSNRAGWHSNALMFVGFALSFLGEVAELRRRNLARMADGEDRGDLHTTVNLRIGHSVVVWLAVDDAAGARRHVREAMSQWSQSGFFLQHYRAMLAEAHIDLYEGAGPRAYDLVDRQWRALKRSFLLYVQYVRVDANFLRARCALASLGDPARRGARLREAAGLARKLDRERMGWTAPLAALVWAGVAYAKGDRPAAIARLRSAATLADAADMRLHAAVARLRLGALVGGAEGEDLDREAREWMNTQEIRVPERIAAMIAPGFET
jgi:serine/threonine protein kinase